MCSTDTCSNLIFPPLYNPKLPDVRNEQDLIRHKQNMKNISNYFDLIGNKEGEEKTIPGKVLNQSHVFFGKEFQNKTQLNKYMNTSEVSINEINDELELLGEAQQKTKKDGFYYNTKIDPSNYSN